MTICKIPGEDVSVWIIPKPYYTVVCRSFQSFTILSVSENAITQVQFLSIIGTVGGSQADPGAREFSKSFRYLDAAIYAAVYAEGTLQGHKSQSRTCLLKGVQLEQVVKLRV